MELAEAVLCACVRLNMAASCSSDREGCIIWSKSRTTRAKMSKSRRKVTVDTAKSVSDDSEKRKPSVFERLGPGGGQRKYDYEAEVNMAPYLYHSLPLFLLLNSLTPPTHTHSWHRYDRPHLCCERYFHFYNYTSMFSLWIRYRVLLSEFIKVMQYQFFVFLPQIVFEVFRSYF